MIAISLTSFNDYGCVNCGCNLCVIQNISVRTVQVICKECKTKFIVLNDSLEQSNISYSSLDYLGNKKYDFPLVSEHPRIGINKHNYHEKKYIKKN